MKTVLGQLGKFELGLYIRKYYFKTKNGTFPVIQQILDKGPLCVQHSPKAVPLQQSLKRPASLPLRGTILKVSVEGGIEERGR